MCFGVLLCDRAESRSFWRIVRVSFVLVRLHQKCSFCDSLTRGNVKKNNSF